MENVVKEGGGGEAKCNNENPNPPLTTTAATESDLSVPQPPPPPPSQQSSSRTPFTNLSQVDADLALARTLQEQERAYMMLRMNGEGSSDFGSSGEDFDDSEDHHDDEDEEQDDDDQDAFDVHENLQLEYNNDFDPSLYTSDEALARALQDGEDRELADRMMALTGGGNAWDAEDTEDNDSQDTWEEVDPDELSYEELIALGEVVGTESRGLSADTIASLPSVNYKAQSSQDGNTEQCVICRLEYEDEETLTMLSCKHIYHSECINNWLQINKVCPVCNTEVSTSENR